jgi:putative PIN family toxin of toxin-antitoxin system
LWRGAPWQVLRLAKDGRITIWAAAAIMREVQDTLAYPRLQPRRLSLGLEITDLVTYALSLVSLVDVAHIPSVVVDDPDDDIFLACAQTVSATYLISGDRHLLVLGQYQGIAIVQPHVFLAREFPPPEG